MRLGLFRISIGPSKSIRRTPASTTIEASCVGMRRTIRGARRLQPLGRARPAPESCIQQPWPAQRKAERYAGGACRLHQGNRNNPRTPTPTPIGRFVASKWRRSGRKARLPVRLGHRAGHKFALDQVKKIEAETLGTSPRKPLDQAQKIPDANNASKPTAPKSSGPTSRWRLATSPCRRPPLGARPSDIEKRDKTWQVADVKDSKDPNDP